MTETRDALSTVEVGAGIAGRIFRRTQQLIDDCEGQPGALIRVLEQTQGVIGYLPEPVLRTVARDLKVPLSEIYGIVSFYHFFTMVPRGRHVIQVCMGTCCYVRGGERILNTLVKELGIEPGQTTSDGMFSLDVVRCLGACGLSPVVAIGDKIYRRVTPNRMRDALSAYV